MFGYIYISYIIEYTMVKIGICKLCNNQFETNNLRTKYCNVCKKIKVKEWRQPYNKSQKARETRKKYYQEHKQERINYTKKWQEKNKKRKERYMSEWKQKNPDYYKNYNKKNWQENKPIESQRHKEYHKKNRDKILERLKKYRQEHKDYFKKYDKIYRLDNFEKIRANNLKNKSEKKEHYKQLSKKYYQSPHGKEVNRNNVRLRRARKKQINHNFTLEEWKLKLNDTNGYCPLCKKYIGIDKLTLDHILPISYAPPNFVYTINMVKPLCLSCNSSKNNKFGVEDFMIVLEAIKKVDEDKANKIIEYLYNSEQEKINKNINNFFINWN